MQSYPFGETATIVSRGVTSRSGDGNDVYSTTSTDVPGCVFDPGGSVEVTQTGDRVTTTPRLFLPAGTAAPAVVDAVMVRGLKYEVDGDPKVFVNPFTGTAPGPVLHLKRVSG